MKTEKTFYATYNYGTVDTISSYILVDGVKVGYEDISYAVYFSKAGDTIDVIKNTTVDTSKWKNITNDYVAIAITKELTINLHGYTVSNLKFNVNKDGNLTIYGDVEGSTKEGSLICTRVIYATGGTTTLNNVNVNIIKTVDDKGVATYSVSEKDVYRPVWAVGEGVELNINGGAVAGTTAILVADKATATLNNVYVLGTTKDNTSTSAIEVINGNATVTNCEIVGGYSGIFVQGTYAEAKDVDTTAEATSTLLVNGKTKIYGNGAFGISTNGNYHYTDITVTGDSKITGTTTGLYAPAYGTYTISGNASILGYIGSGIEIRSGILNISENVTVASYGTPATSESNNNGTTTVGSAIAIAQHTTELPMQISINGGTFTGEYALKEANTQNNSDDDINKITLSITGGEFKGMFLVEDASKISNSHFITAGTFYDNIMTYTLVNTKSVKYSDTYSYTCIATETKTTTGDDGEDVTTTVYVTNADGSYKLIDESVVSGYRYVISPLAEGEVPSTGDGATETPSTGDAGDAA
jgi:hypothetical protein